MSLVDSSAEAEEMPGQADRLMLGPAESDFDFYQRRAMEEARAAQRSTCRRAASSHLYLAAVYSEKLRGEMDKSGQFETLLSRLA